MPSQEEKFKWVAGGGIIYFAVMIFLIIRVDDVVGSNAFDRQFDRR